MPDFDQESCSGAQLEPLAQEVIVLFGLIREHHLDVEEMLGFPPEMARRLYSYWPETKEGQEVWRETVERTGRLPIIVAVAVEQAEQCMPALTELIQLLMAFDLEEDDLPWLPAAYFRIMVAVDEANGGNQFGPPELADIMAICPN